MKGAVWAFPANIKKYPNSSWLVYNNRNITMHLLMYVICWGIAAHLFYVGAPNFWPIFNAFSLGLVFMFFHHKWLTQPTDLALDKSTNSLIRFKGSIPYKVMYSGVYNDLLKKHHHRDGVIVDPRYYEKYKKEGKIKDTEFHNLIKKKRHLGSGDPNISTPFEQIVDVSYFHMIMMFSLAILVAKIDQQLFKLVFPWIILSVFFTLVQSSVWFWVPHVKETAIIFIIKQHLFFIGITFSLAAILIILKFNNS